MAPQLALLARRASGVLLALLVAVAVLLHHGTPAAMAAGPTMPMTAASMHMPAQMGAPVTLATSAPTMACEGGMQTCTAAGIVTHQLAAAPTTPAPGAVQPAAALARAPHPAHAPPPPWPPDSSTVLRI
jgi:hypothetical protein